MSVKSLLQIIIFLLIVSIIGGIYYIYFYTNPSEKKIINIVDNNLTEDNQIAEAPNIDQEQTIELEVKKKEPLKKKN